jgi:hypothetical protein
MTDLHDSAMPIRDFILTSTSGKQYERLMAEWNRMADLINETQAERDSLRAQRDEATDLLRWAFDRLDGWADKQVWFDIRTFLHDDRPQPEYDADEYQNRIARLEEALRPFAEETAFERIAGGGVSVDGRALKRARNALSQDTQEGNR